MRKFWQRFLAYMHWSDGAVCNESVGKGLIDYHDYPDAGEPPMHFYTYTCKRCGKKFEL